MAYTPYAPNATINMQDLDDLGMYLSLPKLARFVTDAVLANPSVIANRRDDVNPDTPVFTTLRLEFDADEIDDIDELERNVTTWAQRCRILGVRGQRLCVVSEPEDNGDTVVLTVLIGTVVFYNERRVTVNVSTTDEELRQDLDNLLPHVPVAPSVERVSDADGALVQILPVPSTVFSAAAFTIDPAQNLPGASLETVVLSLIRLGTEAAPLLVSHDQFDAQELRDRLDNLLLEMTSVRAQLG